MEGSSGVGVILAPAPSLGQNYPLTPQNFEGPILGLGVKFFFKFPRSVDILGPIEVIRVEKLSDTAKGARTVQQLLYLDSPPKIRSSKIFARLTPRSIVFIELRLAAPTKLTPAAPPT